MLFEDFSEISSNLANSFKMNISVNLLREGSNKVGEREKGLIDYIRHYLQLAKEGYICKTRRIYPNHELIEVLNAYNNVYYVLFKLHTIQFSEFIPQIEIIEEEINAIKDVIKPESVINTLQLLIDLAERLMDENLKRV